MDFAHRFTVVHKLSSMTGVHVANQCKLVFSEYGWPEILIPDNGPCYTSQAFINVMKAFSVKLITNSPHYPQSNVLQEKFMQIVKCLFNKAKEEGKDLYTYWMIHQNTPLQVACSHLCRFCKVEVLDLTCQCPMLLGNSLVSSVKVQNIVIVGVEIYEGCGIIIVPNDPMLLDNSDSPSIVEQLSQGPGS